MGTPEEIRQLAALLKSGDVAGAAAFCLTISTR